MAFKIVLTEVADVALEEIIQYYLVEHSSARAAKVVQSIDLAFATISKTPFSFPQCFDVFEPHENIRQITVHSTFKVIYKVLPEEIQVLEIFHGNRNSELLRDIR